MKGTVTISIEDFDNLRNKAKANKKNISDKIEDEIERIETIKKRLNSNDFEMNYSYKLDCLEYLRDFILNNLTE